MQFVDLLLNDNYIALGQLLSGGILPKAIDIGDAHDDLIPCHNIGNDVSVNNIQGIRIEGQFLPHLFYILYDQRSSRFGGHSSFLRIEDK